MSGAHYNRYQRPQVGESNETCWESSAYGNVYNPSFNQQLSVEGEKNIEYEQTKYYVTVSSRDRDRSVHPNVSQYTVNLPSELKNIISVELIQAIIPDVNNVVNEPYLLLKIGEFNDVMISADKNVSDSFAILQMSAPVSPGTFIQIDKRIHEQTVKRYKTPKVALSRVSVSITDADGNLFNFGNDNSFPNPPDKAIQNTFVFRIICSEKARNTLNQRLVF